MRIAVTGGAGFIGRHVVARLILEGHEVIPFDIRSPEFDGPGMERLVHCDLRDPAQVHNRFQGFDSVVALAADIGGIGHISHHEFTILSNNCTIDMNTFIEAARAQVKRLVYASSACVYPTSLQAGTSAPRLKESDAWPALPDGGYGAEKLWAEVALNHLGREKGTSWFAARFHNVYGPLGTFEGGREKAPAALCRKVALALDGESIDIWGSGDQVRTFLHVSDCVDALVGALTSPFVGAMNIGTSREISIRGLAELIIGISGKDVGMTFIDGPVGVNARSCDPQLAEAVLGWTPKVSLEEGIEETYRWIASMVR